MNKPPRKQRTLVKGNPPLIKGMVEVTPKNRKHLEKAFNITIGEDIAYILPPSLISDENSDFWDIEKSLNIKRLKKVAPIIEPEDELEDIEEIE